MDEFKDALLGAKKSTKLNTKKNAQNSAIKSARKSTTTGAETRSEPPIDSTTETNPNGSKEAPATLHSESNTQLDQHPHTLLWLQYSLNRKINSTLKRQLKRQYPNPCDLAHVLNHDKPLIQTNDRQFNETINRILHQPLSSDVAHHIDKAHAWATSNPQHHIIGLDHPAYPTLLQQTANAPPVLYLTGDLSCLQTPCVAIVGARKASHNALEQANQIAHDLAQCGITVVSGLALGVDAAAHVGAMEGAGQTIAVAATGPDRTYPRSHAALASKIANNGAIITEFPLSNPLQPHCFPRRNRIISGLCVGVLVIEAGLPSGTLTTAQHGLRQGREVMALPGSVTNPLSKGCHELIKNGAALVENAQDVLRCLHGELQRQLLDLPSEPVRSIKDNLSNKPSELTPDAHSLLDCLGFDPASVDTLVHRSGLDAARVAGALTYLEIFGLITIDQGGRYTRCKQIRID